MQKYLTTLLLILAMLIGHGPVRAQQNYRLDENFDNITQGIPAGWDNSEGTVTNQSFRWNSTANGYNGTRGVRFDSYNNSVGTVSYLKTPGMDLSAGRWTLSFRYKNPSGGDLSVFLSTDGGATYTTQLVTGLERQNSWTELTFALNDYATLSANTKIVFRGTSNKSYQAYIDVDDVTVRTSATCKAPEGLAVAQLTQTSATLFWGLSNDGDIPTSYSLTVTSADGTVVVDTVGLTAPGATFPLTGLTANTIYNVSMQGDCQPTHHGVSEQATFTFATLCHPQSAPYVNNFDTETSLPDCSRSLGASLSSLWHYGATGKSVVLHSTAQDMAYITFPELNLAATNVEITFFARTDQPHTQYYRTCY